MIDYLFQNLWLVWAIVTFACLILELSSGDFYVTCFAIGALVTIIPAAMECPLWLQIVVWALCSVLSIWFVRPHLLKALHRGADARKSNTDALIGQVGEVSQTIVVGGFGRVKLDGDDWKAEAPHIAVNLSVGTKVRVCGRNSIILSVEPA